jgi:hypothetical protein
MARTEEPEPKPRYLTQAYVARELGYKSNSTVRNLIYLGLLDGVQVSPGSGLRVTRTSFEAYCQKIEAEGAERFGGAA